LSYASIDILAEKLFKGPMTDPMHSALMTGTFCVSAKDHPPLPGAYVLAIELARPDENEIARQAAYAVQRPYMRAGSSQCKR
jgi:hypothetical protein